jgi:hypothetical protein
MKFHVEVVRSGPEVVLEREDAERPDKDGGESNLPLSISRVILDCQRYLVFVSGMEIQAKKKKKKIKRKRKSEMIKAEEQRPFSITKSAIVLPLSATAIFARNGSMNRRGTSISSLLIDETDISTVTLSFYYFDLTFYVDISCFTFISINDTIVTYSTLGYCKNLNRLKFVKRKWHAVLNEKKM